MITGLIATIVILALVFAIFRAWRASGKDNANLKHYIKANEAKDELLEFKIKEKNFIHHIKLNASHLNRVYAARRKSGK